LAFRDETSPVAADKTSFAGPANFLHIEVPLLVNTAELNIQN